MPTAHAGLSGAGFISITKGVFSYDMIGTAAARNRAPAWHLFG
jgi:hypothetical protein